jgi:hypothetical protein
VVDAYLTAIELTEEARLASTTAKAVEDGEAAAPVPADAANPSPGTEGRWGSREVEITDVMLAGPDGERAHVFHSGEQLDIRIRLRAPIAIDDFVIGIGIFNAEGVCCYGTNTSIEDLKGERIFGDAEAIFTIPNLDLVEGTYKLDVAVHTCDGAPYDYHRLLYTFRVKSRSKDVGIYRPKHEWRFSDALRFTRIGEHGS